MQAHSAAPSPSEAQPARRGPARTTTPRGRLVRLGLLAAAGIALLLSGVPLCPFAYLSGVPCPGCGLTRAGLCLLRGDVPSAFALSPLSVVVVPFVVAIAARGAIAYVRGTSSPPSRWITRGALVLWGLLILVWALRFAGMFGGPVHVESVRLDRASGSPVTSP